MTSHDTPPPKPTKGAGWRVWGVKNFTRVVVYANFSHAFKGRQLGLSKVRVARIPRHSVLIITIRRLLNAGH
jgi:hypothetical protein